MKSPLMKHLLLIYCLFIAGTTTARERPKPFIAFSCNEFGPANSADHPRDVYINLNDKVVVKSGGKKTKYAMKDVWGFCSRDGRSYRIIDGQVYQLKVADTLSLYSRKTGGGKHRHTRYYFSQGLCNELHPLKEIELYNVYNKSNPAFLSRLRSELKWYQDYENYNRRRKTYTIVEIYKKTIS
jgi:hypothetical protein